jgi:hypothetical protein
MKMETSGRKFAFGLYEAGCPVQARFWLERDSPRDAVAALKSCTYESEGCPILRRFCEEWEF